jgi:hypothetical protein
VKSRVGALKWSIGAMNPVSHGSFSTNCTMSLARRDHAITQENEIGDSRIVVIDVSISHEKADPGFH